MSQEKLESFLQDQLSGDESVEILIHLDECEECCVLLGEENTKDIIESLLAEDNNAAPGNDPKNLENNNLKENNQDN